MNWQSSKTLALLGGVATLALGSTFMLRVTPQKAKPQLSPCAPRLLELDRSVCEPLPLVPARSAAVALRIAN